MRASQQTRAWITGSAQAAVSVPVGVWPPARALDVLEELQSRGRRAGLRSVAWVGDVGPAESSPESAPDPAFPHRALGLRP